MDTQPATRDAADAVNLNWGDDAPRGGKAVMNRILKEKATVPLFFAQTLVQSMRDVGYNHTTSALCEHVDNAIQAGATEVRVYFRQEGKGASKRIDVAVYDNGRGMSATVLKVAMAFGGSMNFGNRHGIARFGMGMKTAALSMSSVLEVYSWQEREAIYTMTLDVEAIGKERANLVELPDPTLLTELSDEVAELLHKPLSYPTSRTEQHLLATDASDVDQNLGSSGTIVYMPNCDRLHYAKVKTLVDHAVKEMARVYRRAIANGLRLYMNNRPVEAFDPTYSMPNARHIRFLEGSAKQSKLIVSKPVSIPVSEDANQTAPAIIKIYKLPIEERSLLPRKTQKNDLQIFEGMIVSILRNGREVFAGTMPGITSRHSVTNWYRVQIDFEGVLDEAFGVAANKQGVRPKGYVLNAIKDAVGDEIATLNEELKRFQAQQASARAPAKPSESESKASEAEPFQQNAIPSTLSPEEEAQLDANLRGLALNLKRDGESDEEAFERVKSSRYVVDFHHDEYWPFYDVKHRFGRIILTINTAHPFFTALYDPVAKLGISPDSAEEEDAAPPRQAENGALVALDLLLLSLARTQSRLSGASEEASNLLNTLRREWSEAYRVQMTA
jgi:hypothetical protein